MATLRPQWCSQRSRCSRQNSIHPPSSYQASCRRSGDRQRSACNWTGVPTELKNQRASFTRPHARTHKDTFAQRKKRTRAHKVFWIKNIMEHRVHHKAQRFKENLVQHKLAQGPAASAKNPQEKLRNPKQMLRSPQEKLRIPPEKLWNPWEKLTTAA